MKKNRMKIAYVLLVLFALAALAADYSMSLKIDELDDVSSAATRSALLLLQDLADTDRIGSASIGDILDLSRDYENQDFTNGATQTELTEAHMLANRFFTNQGDTVETDVILVDISYYIQVTGIVSEASVIEVCPPSTELFDLDGTPLDADDCVDSPATVGSKAVFTRMLLADGTTWRWSVDTVRGAWVDTGAGD